MADTALENLLAQFSDSLPTDFASLKHQQRGYQSGDTFATEVLLSEPGLSDQIDFVVFEVETDAGDGYEALIGSSEIYEKISSGLAVTSMFTSALINAGALQSAEQHDFYIWNGTTSDITVTSIVPVNAEGVDYSVSSDAVVVNGALTWVASTNSTIKATATRKYTLTIAPTGTRSQLDGTLTFNFSTGFSLSLQLLATEYGIWLTYDTAQRCLLVEINRYDATVEYISNLGYITRLSDAPSNQGYRELLTGVFEVRSRIDGDAVIGNIEVDNAEGDLDTWHTLPWEGWPISVYFGDYTWPRDAFSMIATGTIEALESPNPSRFLFKLRDKRRRLSVPVCATRLGTGEMRPICLGSCFNVPAVYSGSGSTYHVHDNAAITAISYLRDNGVNIAGFTPNLTNGTFAKSTAAYGTLTADVTGATTGTAAEMIRWLALRAGLSESDLDTDSFFYFPNVSPLGLYVADDSTTILDCMNMVMESVGGSWRFNRSGKLQIFRLDAPSSGNSVLTLTQDDVAEMGMSIAAIEPPVRSVTLGYQKNWAVQPGGTLPGGNTAGSVSEANRALYAKEYSTITKTSGTIRTTYPLAEDPPVQGTLIYASADADTEATRRLALRGSKRVIYQVECFALPFSINLGDTIVIEYPRFGFSSGLPVVVIGLRERPLLDRVELEVWR